jgi:hypothetical protein
VKLDGPKPKTLSAKQSALWDAVDTSPHTTTDIAKYCGYYRAQIISWVHGHREPLDFNYNAVMQGIVELSTVTPNKQRINWDSKVRILTKYRAKKMNYSQIARKLNANQSSVRHACLRNGITD